MAEFAPAATLRDHRSLLLSMEAVGWLHMTGKCRLAFLREHGGQGSGYDDLRWFENESPPFPWDELLGWLRTRYANANGTALPWPGTLTGFLTRHRGRNAGLLGLLQAGHGIASGIEKNMPAAAAKYLQQDATHMWLSSAFGRPVRNLLADPPGSLSQAGWARLLEEMQRILRDLHQLGSASATDLGSWSTWREDAIGAGSVLRHAFGSTLAETRLPNNEVTLWDQSYVAAALFKSALASALLDGRSFPWNDAAIKSQVRWRLLTVGIGADHFEARAVRIGDWTGARLALDRFFGGVRRLVEVDLAVGSLLYADGGVLVFSFPGERTDGAGAVDASGWTDWLQEAVDQSARGLALELPPYVRLTESTRSLVPMTREIANARSVLTIPVHRAWDVTGSGETGHVCPVCLVRLNGAPTDKQKPCATCRERRTHRLDAWLGGEQGDDTIWISEVADQNDRLALLTLSLNIEPWLDGSRLDALRTQAVSEWRRHNPTLGGSSNPIDSAKPFASLAAYIQGTLGSFDANNPVLRSLQEGYQHDTGWETFFQKVVEDRADAPLWNSLDDHGRARWLLHQLFCKLASPGRVHRFWRQAEGFFANLLAEFRQLAAADANRCRVRRLVLTPGADGDLSVWRDREVYNGRVGEAPLSLLYRGQSQDFLTVCNLARLLRAEEDGEALVRRSQEGIELRGGDSDLPVRFRIASVEPADGRAGVYHPVIPLELSPLRFRVLLPLSAASACVECAIGIWNDEMARVWDRLPLRAGIVAFPRTVPFQAVIEAARSLEHALEEQPAEETWRVTERDARDGIVAFRLVRRDGGSELRSMPVTLPDGRRDVFYPYCRVEDGAVRTALDFQHPDGQTFRHALDLRPGDGIVVAPSRIAGVFLDSSARRFDEVQVRPLAEWTRMRWWAEP